MEKKIIHSSVYSECIKQPFICLLWMHKTLHASSRCKDSGVYNDFIKQSIPPFILNAQNHSVYPLNVGNQVSVCIKPTLQLWNLFRCLLWSLKSLHPSNIRGISLYIWCYIYPAECSIRNPWGWKARCIISKARHRQDPSVCPARKLRLGGGRLLSRKTILRVNQSFNPG